MQKRSPVYHWICRSGKLGLAEIRPSLDSLMAYDRCMRYGRWEKVTANPAATNADADTVSSGTDANISLAIAMNQQMTTADHPKMADRRNAVRRSFASPDPYAVTRQSYASPPSRRLHTAEITVLIY
jgi:hypothetical protein